MLSFQEKCIVFRFPGVAIDIHNFLSNRECNTRVQMAKVSRFSSDHAPMMLEIDVPEMFPTVIKSKQRFHLEMFLFEQVSSLFFAITLCHTHVKNPFLPASTEIFLCHNLRCTFFILEVCQFSFNYELI